MITVSAVFFDVDSNKMEGKVPDELFALPSIRRLSIQDNMQLTGSIPTIISNSFRSMQLGGTKMGGPIQESFFDLVEMTELNLERASFSGTIPESFINFQDIAILKLNNNTFTGPVPAAFANLTHLNVLFLHGNKLEGSISEAICDRRGIQFSELNNLTADCAGRQLVNCDCCTYCFSPP